MIEDIKVVIETKKGKRLRVPVTIERADGRVYFLKSPFALKDDIKAMQGARWHGYIEGDGRKIWSVADTSRNNFQLEYMQGGNPYKNWDKPLQHWEYSRSLYKHQELMADHCLTYHYKILAAEMGCIGGDAAITYLYRDVATCTDLASFYDWWENTDLLAPVLIKGKNGDWRGVVQVKCMGEKDTVYLTTENLYLQCTPDHEILTPDGWKQSQRLQPGDLVTTITGTEQIESVSPGTQMLVYDVVCVGDHDFAANEIIVHNCGKTLAAIEVMEQSGVADWWWVGPKSAIAAVEREFKKWDAKVMPKLMTYDRLRIDIERWEPGWPAPRGVIFDESSRMKSTNAKRTKAAQHLADAIRKEHGDNGYVILMSGTPAAKRPTDWYAQAEVCAPGFLKEGSAKSFEWRLGIFQKQMTDQGEFWKRVAWKDSEERCEVCGGMQFVTDPEGTTFENPTHTEVGDPDYHRFKPCKNEVAYLAERLDGLSLPLLKKDCLDLPEKIYREVVLEPTSTIKRVAKTMLKIAPTAIQALTLLRELSDGFQYRQVEVGRVECPVCKGVGECEQWEDDEKVFGACATCEGTGEVAKMARETKQLPCPKDAAIRDLLEENEDVGRLVIFAGFQGSIDKLVDNCKKQLWDVIRIDGRGWKIFRADGEPDRTKPLDYWAESPGRAVIVAHPESGGMGLTLTEARMAVFYSNDFKPESRVQAEDRIHRPGMDVNRGATIVDLFHLGTDRKVRNVLLDNRRLEKLTLGDVEESL